jgi:hypothetical protein
MKRNVLIVLAIAIFLNIGKISAQRASKVLAEKLVSNVIDDSLSFSSEFFEMGKELIPELISFIDLNQIGFMGYHNASSSYIGPYSFNFTGMRAAYLIEYILSDEYVANYHKLRRHKFIYRLGIIFQKGQEEALHLNDMKAIKKKYATWWEKNKFKSLDELKEDWRENKRALNNTAYEWK